MSKSTWLKHLMLMTVAALFVLGCSRNSPDAGRSAESFLPNLGDEYATFSDQSVTESLKIFSGFMASPTAFALFSSLDDFRDCMSDYGVLASKVYINKESPDVAGIVSVVNLTRLSSIQVVVDCMTPDVMPLDDQGEPIQPCVNSWIHQDDEASYFIAYAATTTRLCKAFERQLPH
ncbi:MAG: hypothetical protein D6711_12850 [Chloroflexi bacterium]|nr:MAG: hypothetical protein D6711_12850 [Chloroflexota bacterium]